MGKISIVEHLITSPAAVNQDSINDPLDYGNDLALKTLYSSPPGPLPPLVWPTSLLFFLFFLSLSSTNFLEMDKTLDSFHP